MGGALPCPAAGEVLTQATILAVHIYWNKGVSLGAMPLEILGECREPTRFNHRSHPRFAGESNRVTGYLGGTSDGHERLEVSRISDEPKQDAHRGDSSQALGGERGSATVA